MSVIAVARPRTQRVAIAANGDALALIGLSLLVGLLALLTWGTWGDLGRDTGYDLVAGSRLAHGQLPYVDFVYYYGPLGPFLLGLAGWLGGAGLGPAVVLGLVLSALIVAASYALARTQTGPLGAGLVAAIVAAIGFSPTNLSFVLPHTASAPLAVLLALGFLLGIARYADSGRERALAAAGICAGLVALTRPEFELAVILAGALWLVVRARNGVPVRRELALIGVPAALVPAVVYGAFLTAVSPHRLFLENLYPVDTLRAGGSAIIRSQAPLTAGSFATLAGRLLLYAVGAAVLVGLAAVAGRLPRRAVQACTGAAVLLAVAVSVLRPETLRYWLQGAYGWIPAGAVLAVLALLVRHGLRRRPLGAMDQVLLPTLALLAVLAVKSYDGFFFLAERAQPAVYAAPFAVVALARLHLVELARTRRALIAGALWLAFLAASAVGLTLHDARAQGAPVSGPGGTIRVSAAEAPMYRAALAAIEAHSRPGEQILVAPQLTALYTLSGRTDPLPQISLLPGALPKAADEYAAIARLQQARVRVVVTDRHRFTEYHSTAFGGSFDRILSAWIRRDFTHEETLRTRGAVDHTLDIWIRRAS